MRCAAGLLVLLVACGRREEAPAPLALPAPAPSAVVAPPVVDASPVVAAAPSTDGDDSGPVLDAGAPPITQGHFLYIGPKADLARTRARVNRAFVEQGKTNHNGSLPSLRTLDAELKDNYVKITVEGARLRGEMNPALPDPAWEAVFTIDEGDHVTDLVVATIARAPSRPPRR